MGPEADGQGRSTLPIGPHAPLTFTLTSAIDLSKVNPFLDALNTISLVMADLLISCAGHGFILLLDLSGIRFSRHGAYFRDTSPVDMIFALGGLHGR